MKITVAKPEFNKSFLKSVETAKEEGVGVDLIRNERKGVVKVRANIKDKRGKVALANMMFEKDNDTLVLTSKNIIDKDLDATDIMLFELAKFYEKSDIKYIVTE